MIVPDAKILVVDDDKDFQRLLELELHTFNYQVTKVGDGHAALRAASSEQPDLVILDVNLPGLDGLEVCRRLRSDSSVPILMLSALREDYDRIVGLEVGADDYLGKPCNPREMLARVRALLRRSRLQTELPGPVRETELQVGTLRLNKASHEVHQGEEKLSLTPIELSLLYLLMQHHRTTLSRERLIREIWGDDFVGSTRIVDTHVTNLRRKLSPTAPRIEAVRSVGFKLV